MISLSLTPFSPVRTGGSVCVVCGCVYYFIRQVIPARSVIQPGFTKPSYGQKCNFMQIPRGKSVKTNEEVIITASSSVAVRVYGYGCRRPLPKTNLKWNNYNRPKILLYCPQRTVSFLSKRVASSRSVWWRSQASHDKSEKRNIHESVPC